MTRHEVSEMSHLLLCWGVDWSYHVIDHLSINNIMRTLKGGAKHVYSQVMRIKSVYFKEIDDVGGTYWQSFTTFFSAGDMI